MSLDDLFDEMKPVAPAEVPGADSGLYSEREKDLLARKVFRGSDLIEPPKPKIPDASDIVEPDSGVLPRFALNRPGPPLETYVAEAVLAARHYQSARKFGPDTKDFDRKQWIEDAVVSAEKYARWRWQGYQDGEIASL